MNSTVSSDKGPASTLVEEAETASQETQRLQLGLGVTGDTDRPLTMRETLDMIHAYLERIEGTKREMALTALVAVGISFLAVLCLSVLLPWSDGILGSVQAILALDVSWPPVPAPDDPRVAGADGVKAAAWVGAPLVLGVFWFAAAYHLDRAGRRAFRVREPSTVRHSAGYTVMAISVVFPLIVLGLAASAWGIFALVNWVAPHGTWGSAGALVGLLALFACTVRLSNFLLDRRFGG